MSYGGGPYAGGPYAGVGGMVAADIPVDTEPKNFAVEVSFTTDALAEPAWVDISKDVRAWDTTRGRTRELERFQPGRATIVLDNSSRDYDSQHATGPWFGMLRPMRRIRIRETFSGVTYPRFDGYVDRWNLEYPEYGVDAICTVTATDGFKILARTELPRSVYTTTVEDDSPAIWWRLDDNQVQQGDVAAVALNSGTLGTAADGTFVGPPKLGAQSLIVHDPGTAIEVVNSTTAPGTTDMGISSSLDLLAEASWAFECWVRPGDQTAAGSLILICNMALGARVSLAYEDTDGGRFRGILQNTASTTFFATAAGNKAPHRRYHLVLKHGPNRVLAIYVDGVKVTGDTTTGTFSAVTTHVGYQPSNAAANLVGSIDEVAFYLSALATDPLPDDRVAAHYAAGTTPWQGDLPGVRAGRVLDEALWPASLRELDDGQTTFQSASLQ